MSVLELNRRDLLDPVKFAIVANKARAFYRLVYQEMAPCPVNGEGCKICNAGSYSAAPKGWHPRPIETTTIDSDGFIRNAFNQGTKLPNKWPVGKVTLVAGGTEFEQGDGWDIKGRDIIWHDSAPVKDYEPFGLRYQAYREDWVHVSHVKLEQFGGRTKAEESLQLPWAQLEQGQLAISIYREAAGYWMTDADRFIPVDAEMEFFTTVDTETGETQSRHKFVTKVLRAYGMNKSGTAEIEIPGVTYDLARQRFILPSGIALPKKVVVQYMAAPIYRVYLDQGEFRHQGAQDHPRVALLVREEIAK